MLLILNSGNKACSLWVVLQLEYLEVKLSKRGVGRRLFSKWRAVASPVAKLVEKLLTVGSLVCV